MMEFDQYLYRASYAVPVSGPVINDAGILTEHGRVKAIGPFADFAGLDMQVEDYSGHVICPGLVNGHAHLELSHLAHLGTENSAPAGHITDWIRKLLEERANHSSDEPWQDAAVFALARLYGNGCLAVIDIGNLPESRMIGKDFKTEVFFFLELMGISKDSQDAALAALADTPGDICCTAHAAYSAGARLIQAAKEQARQKKCLFPIHVAESVEEVEFLQTGRGPFYDFLIERNVLEPSYSAPGQTPVHYLDSLGVLDEQTLCVHAVHVDEAEIALLAERQAKVCLCPGSNRTLGIGKAPVARFIEVGIAPCLGTDSLSSNPNLSLWQEMRILREDHPDIDPAAVLQMATFNGAKLIGREEQFGQIVPGVSASLLAIPCEAENPDEVLEYLTTAGDDIQLEWIE